MKKLFPVCVVVVAFGLASWAQEQQSLGDAARDNQAKKASRVIDDDNLGSTLSNSNGVQDASAKSAASADDAAPQEQKDAAVAPAAKEDDSAKHRLEVLKEKEASWSKTIDMANKHLETATGMARDMWVRNLASAEEGLSDTRSKMPEAEAAAKAEEAQQQEQAPAPAPPPTDGSAQQ
jgi:hypothetical protein